MSDIRVAFPKPCDEPWDKMEAQGCHRRCDVCDQTIFDLEKLTIDEAEALLARGTDACVRARIGPDGNVALEESANGSNRALKATLGAAASLALAACATTASDSVETPRFTLEGSLDSWRSKELLFLEGAGRRYKVRTRDDQSFRFENVEAGTYRLSAKSFCGEKEEIGTFSVYEGDLDVGKVFYEDHCVITVGKIERAVPPSHG
jgi:hypothetical protein